MKGKRYNIVVNNYYGTTKNLKNFCKEQIITEEIKHFLGRRLQREFNQEIDEVDYKVTKLSSSALTVLALGKDNDGYHVYHFEIEYNSNMVDNEKAFLNSPQIHDTFEVRIPKEMTAKKYYESKKDYFESLKW